MGMPSSNIFGSIVGAPSSYTEEGPPERIIPSGLLLCISSSAFSGGVITTGAPSCLILLPMRCVVCEPKSTISTITYRIISAKCLQVQAGFFNFLPQFLQYLRLFLKFSSYGYRVREHGKKKENRFLTFDRG